jgi:hypothetical protein
LDSRGEPEPEWVQEMTKAEYEDELEKRKKREKKAKVRMN